MTDCGSILTADTRERLVLELTDVITVCTSWLDALGCDSVMREEAQRAPDEAVPYPIKGQGASHTLGEQLAWRMFDGIFAGKTAYRMFSALATKFRGLTPGKQLTWTDNRVPMKPAPKSPRLNSSLKTPPTGSTPLNRSPI